MNNPEILAIENPYLGQYVNSFVIRAADADIFIDAGLYWNRAAYAGLLGGEKRRILLSTHGHWDHIGLASVLRAHGALLHGHPADARFYRDHPWHWKYVFGQYLADVPVPAARKPMFWDSIGKASEIDVPLADGDVIRAGGAELEIVHTPGHSPGSVCLFEKRSGALFTGDTLMGKGFFAAAPMYMDVAAYRASLVRLREMAVDRIYCCHNPVQPGSVLRAKVEDGLKAVDVIGNSIADYARKHARTNRVGLAGLAAAASAACGRPPGSGICLSVLAHVAESYGDEPWARDLLSQYVISVNDGQGLTVSR